MKFRNFYQNTPCEGVINNQDSMTLPDESFTIAQIIQKSRVNNAPPVQKSYNYGGDDVVSYKDVDITDVTDRIEKSKALINKATNVFQGLQEQLKTASKKEESGE